MLIVEDYDGCFNDPIEKHHEFDKRASNKRRYMKIGTPPTEMRLTIIGNLATFPATAIKMRRFLDGPSWKTMSSTAQK